MKVYSFSEARQNLAELLRHASRAGQVEIRRRDGKAFVVCPVTRVGSPLDVPGVNAGLNRGEIVELVRESRQSTDRLIRPRRRVRRNLSGA